MYATYEDIGDGRYNNYEKNDKFLTSACTIYKNGIDNRRHLNTRS